MPAAEVNVVVFAAVTVIVPVAVPPPQPPESVTVYVYVPDAEGVPLIVTVFDDHEPDTPVGNPVTVAPVAPVVVYVIFVIAVLIQTVCALVPPADVNVIVLVVEITVIVAEAPVISLVRAHPFASVIDVNVYAVVLLGFGLALNATPLVIDEYVVPLIIKLNGPVPADEVYVNCPVPPEQMVFPAKLPCGKAFTVIACDALFVHPLTSEMVTVYVVVDAGVTVIDCVVAAEALQEYEVADDDVNVTEALVQVIPSLLAVPDDSVIEIVGADGAEFTVTTIKTLAVYEY